jgi:hypothetical protein
MLSISTFVIASHISYLCLKKDNVGGIYQGTFHDRKSINCLLIMLSLNFLVFNVNKGSSFSLGLAFLFSFYSILFCYSLIVFPFFFEWQIMVFLTMNTNWSCNIFSNIYGMRDIQGKGFHFLSLYSCCYLYCGYVEWCFHFNLLSLDSWKNTSCKWVVDCSIRGLDYGWNLLYTMSGCLET